MVVEVLPITVMELLELSGTLEIDLESEIARDKGKGLEWVPELMAGQESQKCDSWE